MPGNDVGGAGVRRVASVGVRLGNLQEFAFEFVSDNEMRVASSASLVRAISAALPSRQCQNVFWPAEAIGDGRRRSVAGGCAAM